MVLKKYACLDVGERRVGVAIGDAELRLAWPHSTLAVSEDMTEKLKSLFKEEQITDIVVGLPRNQQGSATAQTNTVQDFAQNVLKPLDLPIHWQDESVTSVVAEHKLRANGKPYTKADIDAQAAAIILQDFLEAL